MHCVKSVRIRSFSGPYFLAFGLNTERYSVSFRIQSKYGKIQTRITPNTDTFHVVTSSTISFKKCNNKCNFCTIQNWTYRRDMKLGLLPQFVRDFVSILKKCFNNCRITEDSKHFNC